jgi:hypothetical protein
MDSKQQFDFWYAVNNTELIEPPSNRLETFGETIVNYHLLCEMMDSVNKIRVREGQIKALKPAIITPQSLGQVDVDDFCPETKQYADWLSQHQGELNLIKYGFRIEKNEIKEYIITDPLKAVTERVAEQVRLRRNPSDAILIGVDSPWQVCLVKLMVDLVQRSAIGNMQDFRNQAINQVDQLHETIEKAFLEASRNADRINDLADLLKHYHLFEKYEDRFFALVQASK